MSSKSMEFYRLEDRVLFEAAAAVEMVEAMENNDPNANMNEADRQAQEEQNAIKNAPPENPAAQADADQAYLPDPSDLSDWSDLSDIPGVDAGLDPEVDALISDIFTPQLPEGDLLHLTLNNNGETVSTGKELVIINSSVMDADSIIDTLAPNQEVLRLEAGSDAMQQILDYLDSADTQYDSIHIVSHGNAGYFVLNGEVFDGENFDAAEWAAVGEHVSENGDILLYGCNLAENEAGRDFIAQIADASGADVAASTNATGITGDWTLEYSHGLIETTSISVDAYEYRLNNIQVTVDANSGAGSLRQAVSDASSGDEITFSTSVTKINLFSKIVIDKDLTISGNVNADGFAATEIAISVADRIFTIESGYTVTLDNLILTGSNTIAFAGGGVIIVDSNAVLTLDNVTVRNGVANDGGGIYVYIGSTINVNNSTISGNSAVYRGGGIFGDVGSTINVSNSTISGNSAANFGGGICGSGTLTVLNSIVLGNTAGTNENISADGAFNAAYSIYSANKPATGPRNITTYVTAEDILEGPDANGLYMVKSGSDAATKGVITGVDDAGDYVYRDNASGDWYKVNGMTPASGTSVAIITDQLGYGRNPTSLSIGALQEAATRVIAWSGPSDVYFDSYTTYYFTLDHALANGSSAYQNGLHVFGVEIQLTAELGVSGSIVIMGTADASGRALTSITAVENKRVFYINNNLTVTLEKLILTGNGTVNSYGGVINAGSDSGLTLNYVTVQNGKATVGGGIFSNGTINVNHSVITNNSLTGDNLNGGGIYGSGTINVNYSEITNNSVTGGNTNGGGIYGVGTVTVNNSTISGNSAGSNGGGIFGYINSTITVENSTISGNSATGYNGGGIFGNGAITVENSTISGNSAGNGSGGGVFGLGVVTVVNSTISGNSASNGGGIYGGGTVNILNSIVVGNYAGETSTADDIHAMGALNMKYSVYGVIPSGQTPDATNTRATVQQVFGADVKWAACTGTGAAYELVYGDGTPVFNGKTMAISADGAAAYKGTLVGKIGDDFYYVNKESTTWAWYKIGDNNQGNGFDATGANNYGLGTAAGTMVYKNAQGSTSDIRVQTLNAFNVGAYALGTIYDKTGLVVTTGIDWINPFAAGVSLREAVAYAATQAGSQNITFNASIYTANAVTITLDPGYGELKITSSVSISGLDGKTTTVTVPVTGRSFNATTQQWEDNADPSTFRVFNIAAGTTVSLSNLTLLGGDVGGNYGGVIYLASDNSNPSTLNLDKVTVQGGKASIGGGIFGGNNSAVTLTNSTVSGNSAGVGGGGIYGNGAVTLTNSTVSGNSASNGGGGIFGFGTVTVNKSTISGNSASNGGGGIYGYGTVTVENSTISGNSAEYGGGIYGNINSTITVENSTISGNSATGNNGGGIYGAGTITVVNSTISGNSATFGGGIYGRGAITVENSTVSGNSAGVGAGGIFGYTGGTINILNSIVVGNYAGETSNTNDIYADGALNMKYSVYGAVSGATPDATNTRATVQQVFGADVNWAARTGTGAAYELVYGDGTPVFNGKTMVISADGAAAYKGTLTAKIGDVLWYKDGAVWRNFTDDTTKNFTDNAAENYGLGVDIGTQVYTTAQNLDGNDDPVSRVQTTAMFNVGAYALNVTAKSDSLVVSTTTDWLNNVFSTKTSLREALAYAATQAGSQNITFDASIYTANAVTITLDPGYGELKITSSVSISGLAGKTTTVTVPVAGRSFNATTQQWENNANPSTFRVFDIAAGTTVSLSNLTLLGGDISGNYGGVIYLASDNNNPSTLNLDKVTVQGGKASNGGGIYGNGTITVENSTISGNSADFGGGICGNGTITVENSTISGNSADFGGGIYGYGTITVENSTISGNSAANGGGGIYGGSSSTITVENSTISGNSAADNGGGIYGYGTITVVNSTISGNSAIYYGGGIFGSANSTVNILNSIVVGNYVGEPSNTNDIHAVGALNMKYSVYGVISDWPTVDATNIRSDVAETFGAEWAEVGGKWTLVKIGTTTPILQDGVMAILTTSRAAGRGVLTGTDGNGNYYYSPDGSEWFDLDGNVTLEPVTVYTLDQKGDTRTAPYSIGALDSAYIPPPYSLVVDSFDDVIDWTDGVTTLREAIISANHRGVAYNWDSNGDGVLDGYRITFDAALGNDVTITLDALLGELLLEANIFIDGGATSRNITVTVENVGVTQHRVFNIADNMTVQLDNLTLKGGDISGNNWGGVINAGGSDLSLNYTTATGGKATWGGGIIGYGTITVVNSTISGNSATEYGGGIFGSGTVTVINSTISGNSATEYGGGIFGYGTITVVNSIVLGNYSGGDTANADDIYYYSDEYYSVTLNMEYSVYGAVSKGDMTTREPVTVSATNIRSNVADVFGAEWAEVDGKWTLVEIGTTTPILQQGVMAVLTDGPAADNGVLTGSYDDSGVTRYAYWNGSGWTDVNGSEVTATVTEITLDQKGDTRNAPYSIGALDSSYIPPPYSLVVNSFDDVIDWTDGVTTLREAIISANHRGVAYNWDSNGDGVLDGYRITFDAALGNEFTITLDALLGELALDANIFIDGGATSRKITITVAEVGVTQHRVFNIADNLTVQLDNLTLKGGDISGFSLDDSWGGVIYAGSSDLSLNYTTVTGGKAAWSGGIEISGNLLLTNSTVSGNTASDGGGGIYGSGTIMVVNSTISGNTAGTNNGGGIYGESTITVDNSTISGNSAEYGGGIYCFGTITVVNSTISGNTAASSGGGIYGDMVTVINSTVSGNSAEYGGGGIYGDMVTVINSTVSGNSAGFYGGGIFGNGTITVLNSIVLGNYSGGDTANADDIYYYSDENYSGMLNMEYSVYGAVNKGDMTTREPVTVSATNIRSNVADVFGAEWAEVGGKWTLVEIGTTTPILQNGVMSILSDGPAADNGVLTGTDGSGNYYYSQNGSEWFDLDGNAAAQPAEVYEFDQKGDTRNAPYSIGALDSSYVPPAYSLVVDSLDDVIDWTDGVTTLREAIYAANHGLVAFNWGADGYQITFDAALGNEFTITLDALLGELALAANIFIDGGATSRNITITVENVGVTAHRVFNIANNMIVQLDNLTLQGGDISGFSLNDSYGGVIYAGSGTNLTLNDSTVTGGKAASGGGIFGNGAVTVVNSTISGNSATYSIGGGIFGDGTITVENSTISGNEAANGGGIFGSSTVTVENSTISGNTATDGGGGIYGSNNSTITVENSTISGNEAIYYGGGISGFGTITVVNSTISGNSATYSIGGGIYGSTVNILNSIVVGNYAGEPSDANDIYAMGALNMKYSVYGVISGGLTVDATNIRSDIAETFGAEWAEVDGKWTLVEIGTTTPILQQGVMAILETSAAAGHGVLAGTDGNGNYFYSQNGTDWFDMDGGAAAQPATVYTLDQKGDVRNAPYSIGALDSAYIPPPYSLVVDSFDDVIDWTDGVTTLREAIEAANRGGVDYNWDSNGDGTLDGYRITFDAVLGNVFTITLDAMLGELALNANIFIDGGATSRHITITVEEVGVTTHRVFNIADNMTVQLDNLTLKGGDVSGNSGNNSYGGVICAWYSSDLTLNNITVTGGKAAYGGGIESFGNLTLNDSTVSGNSAEYYGGGIDFDSNGDLTLINSTISGNSATNGSGGGIYNNWGTIMVVNSTVSDNSAEYGGGISGDTVTVINSTVSGNSAEYGGGISGNTITVINSTVSGNSAEYGGGIFGFGAITVLNSIVLGNYSGGDTANADDIYYYSDEYYSATLTMEYSVYGTVNKGDTTTREPVTVSATNIQSNVADVFGAEWAEVGGKWTLVEIGTATPILQQGVMTVQIDGPAANGGVLTGSYDDDGTVKYAYWNGSGWTGVDGSEVTATVMAITTDQKGDVRNAPYSIGALDSSYVPEPKEDPSLTVTTLDDIVDAYDGVISLREALMYAQSNPELGYTIMFDDALFANGNDITITIDSELMIMTELLIIDGGFGRTVTVKVQETGVSNYRVFATTDDSADWDLTLRNLHLQGGYVDGWGGALYISGNNVNLSLENVTISGSNAEGGGGGIYVSGNTLNVDIINSTIAGNTTYGSYGGGVAVAGGDVTVNVINSTIAGNTGNSSGGGGIDLDGWSSSTLNLINSIILGNYDMEGNANDVYVLGNGTTFNAAYSIYGAYNADEITGGDRSMGNIEDATVEDVFTGEFVDGVLAIRADGPAAGNGTLAGYGNGDFYFMHNGAWVSFTGSGTPTEIFIFAQNRDDEGDPVRRDEGEMYSIGAYAIDATPVPPVDDDGGNRITSSGLYLDYSSTLPNMQVVEAMRNSEANFASSVGNTGFNQSAARTYTEYLSTIGAGFSWSSGRPYGTLPGANVHGEFRPAWAGGSGFGNRPGLGEAFESTNEMQDIRADIVELELPGATRSGQFTFGGNRLNGPHFVAGWSRDGVDQLILTDTAEPKVSGNAMFAYLDEALPPIVRRQAIPALASDLPELAAVEVAELDKSDAFKSIFDRVIEEILTI